MPDKFELVACADHDPERLVKDVPEQLKNVAKYPSLEEMLKHPGLDMVTIAVRHPDHVPMAIQILEAGKIAVVEKPVATSVAEMEHLLAVAKIRTNSFSVTTAGSRRPSSRSGS